MTGRRRSASDESGATAVLFAILSLLLFAAAAIAVDLGNAWARQSTVQRQVDVAALSAGDLLPATTASQKSAVAARLASYLGRAPNRVLGQTAPTAAQLQDGNAANGEVTFTTDGQRLTLQAPRATVRFTLAPAALLPASTSVGSRATVGVFSALPRTNLVPFWLPDCPYGAVDADTSNGGGNGNGGNGNGGTSTGTPATGTGGSPTSNVQSTAQPDTANRYENNKTITFRVTGVSALSSDQLPVVQFEKLENASLRYGFTGTWTKTSGDQDWAFTIVIGASDVTAHVQQWKYQTVFRARTGNRSAYSPVMNFNIQPSNNPAPTPTPAGCPAGQNRGNFGQLDSPRNPALNNQTNLATNIAAGLDHQLTTLANAAADECTNPPRTREQLDNVSRDGNNCIKSDTGNDGPALADGLVKGVGSHYGRLDARRGTTRTGCNAGNASVGGVSINDDLLTCYMIGTSTPLSALTTAPTASSTPLLDPAVVKSPRFVWLPQVYKTDRSSKNFQPIKRFVPGFITDESTSSTRSSSTHTSDNGLVCNGNRSNCNSLSAVKMFTFDPGWLPIDERSPLIAYNPLVGQRTWTLTQ